MSKHPRPRGYDLRQPTPNYQLIYPPYDINTAPLPDDPYDLYNWQAIEPSSSRGVRSSGFGTGPAAGLGVEPISFYEYGANGASSYEPESLYGDPAIGANLYAPRQSRGQNRYQDYGHGSHEYEGSHHGGSYDFDAHDKTSHQEGKRRAYDTSTSQRPRHHDNGRSGGRRGHEYDEQVLADQMLAMSLQNQEDEYSVKEEPHHHRRHHHHLGSSREYSEHPPSRARGYEYDEQSTSTSAHQGHGGRHRGHGVTSDHHRGGSKSSSRKAACGVCFDEFPVAHLFKLCALGKCPRYCASCTKHWFKTTVKSMPKMPIVCCKESVNIDSVAHLFKPHFVEEYKAIQMEFDTEDKLYCSYKECSAFIPPPSIKGKNATCQECGRQTCTRCKNASHRRSPCRSNPEDEKLKELGYRKGWQQCVGCGNLVSKNGGCPHIKCTVCGADWCYYCGSKDCDTQRCQRERNMYPFDD